MDDLRDYRYYEEDMLHPSALAVNYIWERLSDCAFHPEVKPVFKRLENLSRAVNHRPFDVASSSHQNFVKKQLVEISELAKLYPHMNLAEEESRFLAQLEDK